MTATVSPPLISANKSFFMLYFGSQMKIGNKLTRNREIPCQRHNLEASFFDSTNK